MLSGWVLLPLCACLFWSTPGITGFPASGLPAETGPDEQLERVEALGRLINRRLSLMKDVAAYKWEHRIPIEDLQREKEVLESSIQAAESMGLNPTASSRFFEQQIELAKSVQQYWFDQWESKGFEQYDYADLTTEIRPVLLELGDKILFSVANLDLQQDLKRKKIKRLSRRFAGTINTIGVARTDKKALFESVQKIITKRS